MNPANDFGLAERCANASIQSRERSYINKAADLEHEYLGHV